MESCLHEGKRHRWLNRESLSRSTIAIVRRVSDDCHFVFYPISSFCHLHLIIFVIIAEFQERLHSSSQCMLHGVTECGALTPTVLKCTRANHIFPYIFCRSLLLVVVMLNSKLDTKSNFYSPSVLWNILCLFLLFRVSCFFFFWLQHILLLLLLIWTVNILSCFHVCFIQLPLVVPPTFSDASKWKYIFRMLMLCGLEKEPCNIPLWILLVRCSLFSLFIENSFTCFAKKTNG